MDLAQIHAVLLESHEELLHEPASDVEGLDGASCPPHVKHLAQIAFVAASEGYTAQRWRTDILEGLGPDVAPLLQRAEDCMHDAGLWPWNETRDQPDP